MEDAGLDENIAQHTEVVDNAHGDNDQDDEDNHTFHAGEVHLNQTRWWFASAAFPMIAGTLGPVASAFSILALVKPWRQHIPPRLVIAIIANLFLLLNMTKRVRFTIAQPITIVGWYISSILLIALCSTASGPLLVQPEIEYVWSQAFYYGLFAAVLYFIISSLMVITVWGAQAGHYPYHFELTISQRTLMLQTISFLTYLLLGALVFSHVEDWLYLDAVYWADVTLFTVGLGDVSLKTNLGRGLMIPYALIGITTLGLVIGSIRSLILDRGKSAKIFQECEAPYQNWSYFDGIYFSFQAMTTIGYGDVTPVSNPAKAFFVFWSLLALPTLTVLISHAGDTVVKGIRDATVLLGSITILPGERGYMTDIKHFLSKLSFGVLFAEEEIHESPPGFLGAAQPHSDGDDGGEDESIDDRSCSPEGQDNEGGKVHGELAWNSSLGQPSGANVRTSTLSKLRNLMDKTKQPGRKSMEASGGQHIPDKFPKTRAEYRLVLMDGIRKVSQELQHSPPKNYSYQEWAWYLRLIGEDESDASTHRRPSKKPHPASDENATQHIQTNAVEGGTVDNRQKRAGPKWSWIDHLSPLMDTRDEAEWILDKLSQRLRQELQNDVKDDERNAREMEDWYHGKKSGI
ncbi:hypothetical protein GQX73_g7144 [Xylaria multiplex]|uniref:Potassium channel domain-containing protein n=1 Tax=Xylaria multiplex TaxID=323545 RepID=A0A7C8N4K9_9PEZI|nr:hypothetical protein GQX73_g7144 [Xylaria multiplex]